MRSLPQVATSEPSGLTATARTQPCAPWRRSATGAGFSEAVGHQISLPSQPPVSSVSPSGWKARAKSPALVPDQGRRLARVQLPAPDRVVLGPGEDVAARRVEPAADRAAGRACTPGRRASSPARAPADFVGGAGFPFMPAAPRSPMRPGRRSGSRGRRPRSRPSGRGRRPGGRCGRGRRRRPARRRPRSRWRSSCRRRRPA